jgi:hypothetical protein
VFRVYEGLGFNVLRVYKGFGFKVLRVFEELGFNVWGSVLRTNLLVKLLPSLPLLQNNLPRLARIRTHPTLRISQPPPDSDAAPLVLMLLLAHPESHASISVNNEAGLSSRASTITVYKVLLLPTLRPALCLVQHPEKRSKIAAVSACAAS